MGENWIGDAALLGLGIYAIDRLEKRKNKPVRRKVRKYKSVQKRKGIKKKKDDLFPKWSDIKL